MPNVVVGILGYGASSRPLQDGNLKAYLAPTIRGLQDVGIMLQVYLLGGYTNRLDLSEAAAMRMWIAAHYPCFLPCVRMVETTKTARENIEALAQVTYPDDVVIIFCEYSRRWIVRMLAQRLLPGRRVRVFGIKFDTPSLRLRHRLYQAGPRLALEWASLHNRYAEAVRAQLRAWCIEEARHERDAQRG